MNDKRKQENQNLKNILKKYFRKDQLFLLPNIFCYVRVLLMVAFCIIYLTPFTLLNNPNANIHIAAGIMIVAAYTDFLDGYIARTFNMQSDLGKVLDPICDKLLQATIAVVVMIKLYMFHAVFAIFAIFFLKEVSLIFQDIYLARKNRTFGHALWYGKVSTFIFYLCLGALLVLAQPILMHFPLDTASGFYYSHIIIDSISTLAIAFLLLAFILYSIDLIKIIKSDRAEIIEESKEEQL